MAKKSRKTGDAASLALAQDLLKQAQAGGDPAEIARAKAIVQVLTSTEASEGAVASRIDKARVAAAKRAGTVTDDIDVLVKPSRIKGEFDLAAMAETPMEIFDLNEDAAADRLYQELVRRGYGPEEITRIGQEI